MPHSTTSQIEDQISRDLFQTLIDLFYSNLALLSYNNKKHILFRGTGATLRYYLLKGIERFDHGNIAVFPEMAMDKSEKRYGYADVIFGLDDEFILLETKAYWADTDEPNKHHWEDAYEAEGYYKKMLDQPNRYYNGARDISKDYSKKLIAIIIFARLELSSSASKTPINIHPLWRNFNKCNENEFYAFDEVVPGEYAVAIYGKIRQVN